MTAIDRPGRPALIPAVAGVVGGVAGFFLGFFALLSLTGLDRPGWMPVATLTGAAMLATLAGGLAAGLAPTRSAGLGLGSAAAGAAIGLAIQVIDLDLEVVVVAAGLLVITSVGAVITIGREPAEG